MDSEQLDKHLRETSNMIRRNQQQKEATMDNGTERLIEIIRHELKEGVDPYAFQWTIPDTMDIIADKERYLHTVLDLAIISAGYGRVKPEYIDNWMGEKGGNGG